MSLATIRVVLTPPTIRRTVIMASPDVAREISARRAADDALQTDIDSLESRVDTLETSGGGGGGGGANLGITRTATTATITSDSGTDATIPAADASNAGVMTAAQVTKLAGIATGATANSSDATLLSRNNHTDTQAISTITGLQDALDGKAPTFTTSEGSNGASDSGKVVVFDEDGALSSSSFFYLYAGNGSGHVAFALDTVTGVTGPQTITVLGDTGTLALREWVTSEFVSSTETRASNTFCAGPADASVQGADFRRISADDLSPDNYSTATATNVLHGNMTWEKVALAADVSGMLPVANGGTGLTAVGSARQRLMTNAAGTAMEFADEVVSVGFSTDGAGSAIPTGKVAGYVTVPFAATIVGYSIMADTGTCTIKTWKKASGTAVPTVSDNISTSGVSLSTGTTVTSTTTSDFTTTAIAAGDILAFNITSLASATELTFQLKLKKL